jgi:hypothetical protein
MSTNQQGAVPAAGNLDHRGGKHRSPWKRPACVTATVLLIPLLGNQFVDGWNWSIGDFIFASVLLFGSALAYELIARKSGHWAYRTAIGITVVTAFLLVWVNLAVGVIGEPDRHANAMFLGVLAIGLIGALLARFRPHGMSRALLAMALTQVLVAGIILLAGFGSAGPKPPLHAAILTACFAAPWFTSAWLFRKGAGERAEVGAG